MTEKTYKYKPAENADEFTMLPVEINSTEEQWTKVFLEDGTVLKVRIVVSRAARSTDKPIPDSNGEPLYRIHSNTIVVADVPDELRFPPEE